MKKAAQYRQHAEECRTLAARTSDPEHKKMLMEMAETWNGLAKQRAEKIARQRRIAELEGSSGAEISDE